MFKWILFLLFFQVAHAQVIEPSLNYYLIYFTDKPIAKVQRVNLCDKSLERREKQHISLKESDYPVCESYLLTLKNSSIKIVATSRWLNAIVIYAGQKEILHIEKFTFVKKVLPLPDGNMVLAQQKNINAVYPLSSNVQLNMMGLDRLHAQGFTGKGKLIAVFDNGFTNVNKLSPYKHIFDENRLITTRNFVNPNRNVFETGSDGEHGSRVFSTIAALMPPNFIGAAYDASFILAVTEDMSKEGILEEINWLLAAEWADSIGADIISSSLGYAKGFTYGSDHTYDELDGKTTIVCKAANFAASKGILVVNSAGNEGITAWQYIISPADADSCLAVGAVDADRQYVNFSSKGPTFDGRTKPDLAAMGGLTITLLPTGNLKTGNGTSFACPLTAGLAACLWQVNDTLKNMDLFYLLKQSGSQASNPDNLLGWGIPNSNEAYKILTGKDLMEIPKNENRLQVIPNPIQNEFRITFFCYQDPIVASLLFYNLGSAETKEIKMKISKGFNQINLFARDLKLCNGLYVIQLMGLNQIIMTENKILIVE